MLYVIVDRDGRPLADLQTGEHIVFPSREEARKFVMTGEVVAAWLDGGRKIVPLTK